MTFSLIKKLLAAESGPPFVRRIESCKVFNLYFFKLEIMLGKYQI